MIEIENDKKINWKSHLDGEIHIIIKCSWNWEKSTKRRFLQLWDAEQARKPFVLIFRETPRPNSLSDWVLRNRNLWWVRTNLESTSLYTVFGLALRYIRRA